MISTTETPQLLIHGYRLELICAACPEQYDVYDQAGTQVAYLRLLRGRFTASVPERGGNIVYSVTIPEGHGTFGAGERLSYLTKAIEAVQAHIANFNIDCRTDY